MVSFHWERSENRVPADFPDDRRGLRRARSATGGAALGGGQDPALLADLPGDPVVVGYAPQLDLIHRQPWQSGAAGQPGPRVAGKGVPMVVMPVAYDQPGLEPGSSGRAWAGRFRSGG